MLRRLGGFTLLPLLSLVTPFVLLPVVARVAGPQGWSSVVAGQSVGTFGATVVYWGWNVIGPVEAARARGPELTRLYGASLRTRLLLLAPVLPACAAVTVLVARPGYRLVAVSMALATVLLGLSPAWWGIGVGRPSVLLWFDSVPRVAAAALAVPVVLATRAIWAYPVLLVATTVVGLVAFQRRHAPGADWAPWPAGRAVRELRAQAGTAGVNLVGTAYASTPAPIATAAFPGAVASPLTSADAVYRLGLFAVVATGNAFQGWTLEPEASDHVERHRRRRTAELTHLALGVAGLLVLAALGPWLTGLLFGAAVAASRELGVAYGVAFLLISASTPFVRNVLLPAGRTGLVLGWTAASAVVGLAIMLAAAATGWLPGVAWGMAASELVLLVGVVVPARRLRRAS